MGKRTEQMTKPLPPEPDRNPDVPDNQRQSRTLADVSDPYVVLGLERGASQAQVRQAYFALVREHSPEKDSQTFKAVRAAYEQLGTEETQAETDLFLLQPPPAWHPPRSSPALDLAFHAEDALIALQAWDDIGHIDLTDDFREVEI
jgi:curved DNA-binding protein CbpA